MADGFNTTVLPEAFNVTWSIDYMQKNLKGNHTDVPANGITWKLTDSFNLRFLIHYVGDIHQPLHTTSMFSEQFQNGDAGGNSFLIGNKDNIGCLHALWDSCVYEFDQDYPTPLSYDNWVKLGDISASLQKEHPIDSADILEHLSVPEASWADEGHTLAVNYVYNTTQNQIPTDEYVKIGQGIVHHQLALGGYRLALLIADIYGQPVVQQPESDTFLN